MRTLFYKNDALDERDADERVAIKYGSGLRPRNVVVKSPTPIAHHVSFRRDICRWRKEEVRRGSSSFRGQWRRDAMQGSERERELCSVVSGMQYFDEGVHR